MNSNKELVLAREAGQWLGVEGRITYAEQYDKEG